jgi:hypothetical protein
MPIGAINVGEAASLTCLAALQYERSRDTGIGIARLVLGPI